MTITAPLRETLSGLEFMAEALALHDGLPAGARWAINDLAQHIGGARAMLATVEARLAMDAEPVE